jgi:predicted esterase YcpF (UPF0227 family)
MKKRILYIHGFNSAASDKLNFLNSDKFIIDSISLNYNPNIAIEQLESYIKKHDSNVQLIGMSLGGFYAIYLTEKFGLKNTILLNPSVNAHKNLQNAIGENINYKTNELYIFTEENLLSLEAYKVNIINCNNYYCFIGLNDIVVDPNETKRHFNNLYFLECGHRINDELLKKQKNIIENIIK